MDLKSVDELCTQMGIDIAALAEHVDAEAPDIVDLVGEVGFAGLRELARALLGHER